MVLTLGEMADTWARLKETRLRLEKNWDVDIDWSLYPDELKEVCLSLPVTISTTIDILA